MVRGPLGEALTADGDGLLNQKYDHFKVSIHDGICEIVMCRPDTMNGMNFDMIREFHDILDTLQYPLGFADGKTPARAVVLRGEGRAFCAGFDFKESRKPQADQSFLQHAYSGVIKKLREIPQPVVCGVNGAAAGGGMSLALASDVILGHSSCKFAPSYVNIGLGGGELGTSYFLPRIVGKQRTASILLTGRVIDAVTAERWGILSKIVDSQEELIEECRKVAAEMVACSPKGLRLTKWLLNNSQDMSFAQVMDREDLAQTFLSGDKESMLVGKAYMDRFKTPKSKL